MTATLVRDDFGAAMKEASAQVDFALSRVAQIDDGNSLAEARIALDAAKELSRLHGLAAGLRVKLVRLELHIARRAGQLGVKVKGVTASVGKWYADKTDADIEALIDRHHGKSAATSIMKAELALNEFTKRRATATQKTATQGLEVTDAGETLAAIVTAAQDEFYDRDSIGVSDITDYVGDLVGVPTFDEDTRLAGLQGLRLGLWDAVRKSLSQGDLDDERLDGLPRWVTCKGPDSLTGDRRYNLRVPTSKASLRQLGEYVDLIEEKGRQNLARARRLGNILDQLRSASENAAEVDGEAAYWIDSLTVGEAAALLVMAEQEATA